MNRSATASPPTAGGRTLVAVERDRARFGTLSSMLTKAGVGNTKLVNGDFLKLRPEEHPRVSAILLDPSCSGTGQSQWQAVCAVLMTGG